jgi:hypothetical protein
MDEEGRGRIGRGATGFELGEDGGEGGVRGTYWYTLFKQ